MKPSLNATGKGLCFLLLVSLSFSFLVLAFHHHQDAWSRVSCPLCKHLAHYSGMAPQEPHEIWADQRCGIISDVCSPIHYAFHLGCHSLERSPPV